MPAWVLAIEPDPESGAALAHALAPHLHVELVIVGSVDDALDVLETRTPDLILTSTFLAPPDDARLSAHLRRRAELLHTQVITLPQFVLAAEWDDQNRDDPESGVVLRFRPRRTPQITARCDAATLREQIEAYLEQARMLRERIGHQSESSTTHWLDDRSPATDEPIASASSEGSLATGHRPATPPPGTDNGTGLQLPRDRRRASRRRAGDLAGQLKIVLPAGGDVSLVDISRLGALLETSSKLSPGSLINIQVLGLEDRISVPARLVRSEIAAASDGIVRYRVAAAFCRQIDFLAPPAAGPAANWSPKVLGDLLGRVLADASWVSNGEALCARFEAELGHLVPVRAIRICASPTPAPPGCESAAFGIPGSGSGDLFLQVVFEPGHHPAAAEMRLLKAAAALASVVLDLTGAPPDSPAD